MKILASDDHAREKRDFIAELGADNVVAIGNGRNDREMLESAAVGVALIQREGGATQAVLSADIVSTSIHDALDLLRFPKRLTATLRS